MYTPKGQGKNQLAIREQLADGRAMTAAELAYTNYGDTDRVSEGVIRKVINGLLADGVLERFQGDRPMADLTVCQLGLHRQDACWMCERGLPTMRLSIVSPETWPNTIRPRSYDYHQTRGLTVEGKGVLTYRLAG